MKQTLLFALLLLAACKIPANPTPPKSSSTTNTDALWAEHKAAAKKQFGPQWSARQLQLQNLKMPFFYQKWGEAPKNGYPLFISLHGGGGAPPSVNDQQYRNQQHLYDATMKNLSGIYLAPRAATDEWNLWHQTHIDTFLARLILLAHIEEGIDLNRVYLLGYSAGGDGVYQLAPRMADRLAAASMMAGHPNDAQPLSLRNLPFALFMGSEDAAYDRNKVVAQWAQQLQNLALADSAGGYISNYNLVKGKGHWMELQDAVALPWMSNYTRNPLPTRVVWAYDKQQHQQFYWLGLPKNSPNINTPIIADYNRQNNSITIRQNPTKHLHIYINAQMLDLDKPVKVYAQDKLIFEGRVEQNDAILRETLAAKSDPNLMFPVRLELIDGKILVSKN